MIQRQVVVMSASDNRVAGLPEDPAARERLRELLEARAEAVSWRCNLETCDGTPHEGKPKMHARTQQRPPWGEVVTLANGSQSPIRRWYLRGGRGSGKTWAGAHALMEIILWNGGRDALGDRREYGIIGPSFKYAKETLLEGGSGLIRALGGEDGPHIETYNRSTGTLTMKSGAIVYTAGADNFGKGIEGKNLTAVWLDEVGLWSMKRWKYVWEQAIRFAVRKDPALYIMTGTPKEGHPFVKELASDPRVKTVVMATADNKALTADQLSEWEAMYAGTRLGRQELYGEILLDTPGALWTHAMIEDARIDGERRLVPTPEEMIRIVVAWDPAVTSNDDSDEHGIVVAAQLAGEEPHFVVLDDVSGRYTPMEAVRVVADAYEKWAADSVIAETNNGGDLIPALLRTGAPTIPVTTVTATRGKRLRAEPVAALSEQGRLHLVGVFPALEEQMTTWSPAAAGSPDRLDALVWAITALNEKTATSRAYFGKRRIQVGGK